MLNPIKSKIMSACCIPVLASALLIAGCGTSGDTPSDTKSISLNMNLPDSMTGGKVAAVNQMRSVVLAASQGTGEPCGYMGSQEQDPFQNGYKMTKFMVSAMAAWTCVADLLIDLTDLVDHDGAVHATDNVLGSSTYKPGDPTHYSVTDDSSSQTTIRLYYGYDQATPPAVGEDPQFFVSWNKAENGDIEGRMVIDALTMNPDNRKADDPTMMRLDFNYTSAQKMGDMFLSFDEGNQWANGFRIKVIKDLSANSLRKVFVSQGLIDVKAQFLPVAGIDELPSLRMYTVSDSFGNGAAIADFQDVSLPFELNADTGNNLGNYIFSKTDKYFFTANQSWEYVYKTFSTAEYRGGRTTPASGGTFLPFDPSLDIIISGLGLDPNYFTDSLCANVGDDCSDLLNAVFQEGFAGQEPNQGTDPMDWRSDAIASPVYLDTVYPNGTNWDGAFDFSFTPAQP